MTVISHGRVVVQDGRLEVAPGSGQLLPRGLSDYARPLGRLQPETDPRHNFGAVILS